MKIGHRRMRAQEGEEVQYMHKLQQRRKPMNRMTDGVGGEEGERRQVEPNRNKRCRNWRVQGLG